MPEKITLPYGQDGLTIDFSRVKAEYIILENREEEPPEISVDDLHQSFANPIGSQPLKDIIRPDDSVCIVTSDGTRPFPPTRLMLNAILENFDFTPKKITVITGSGSHKPHTEEELEELFCRKLFSSLEIISHDSRSDDNVTVGQLPGGAPVKMNRRYVEADKRIVLGHIEPHLFTGFSGGPKGIAPALCGIETIHALHSYEAIADKLSAYGKVENNVSAELIREAASFCPPDFLVNVVLNKKQKPIAAFSGHYIEAHRRGIALSRRLSAVETDRMFPIVVTSNAGYPLDQNLYQTVKGIDAAYRLVEPGGTIIIVSECSLGIPEGSSFEKILTAGNSIETILKQLSNDKGNIDDRWQVQRLCEIILNCSVILVSSLDESITKRCRLGYADTVEDALERAARICDGTAAVAILTYGPLTIVDSNKPINGQTQGKSETD